MSLQLAARPGCTLVCGVSGSGKTTFALRWLAARKDLTCRFLFQEPKRDLSERLKLPDAETAEELECAVEDGWVIFHPGIMFSGDWPAALAWFSEWSYAKAASLPGRKILMVDEVWKYCSPHAIPRGLSKWIQDGRSFGCETVFATQTPNKLHASITNEATELVAFRLQGKPALDCVTALGVDREEVASLPPGSFVARNCETGAERRARLW